MSQAPVFGDPSWIARRNADRLAAQVAEVKASNPPCPKCGSPSGVSEVRHGSETAVVVFACTFLTSVACDDCCGTGTDPDYPGECPACVYGRRSVPHHRWTVTVRRSS